MSESTVDMIKIALLGFGTVGRAFARYLETLAATGNADYGIAAVADISGGVLLSDPAQVRLLLESQNRGQMIADGADPGSVMNSFEFIQALGPAGIPVLVECLPTDPATGQPGRDLIECALNQGIAVVTVDKGPMVHDFMGLTAAARRNGTRLAYSGTTGVRPPADISGCHVLDIRGILNGTTNYILTEMHQSHLTFKQALAQARDQGIAEPNPDLDIQGWDTACKILILANEWMQAESTLDDVIRIGIGPETEQMIRSECEPDQLVRLIGHAHLREGRVQLSVAPKIIGSESVFYSLSGTSKGAVFRTREMGEILVKARSGLDAIAHTILEDIRTMTASDAP